MDEQEDGRRRRRTYEEAFKQSAVRLIVAEGYSFKAAAVAVGVSEGKGDKDRGRSREFGVRF